MIVRCINNKDFEARLEIDKVYNVMAEYNYGYFIQINGITIFFEKRRFEVCK